MAGARVSGTAGYGTGFSEKYSESARPGLSFRCGLILAFLLLITVVVVPTSAVVPTANFSTNVTTGVVPFDVSFTDISTGSPTSWNWSFGDGVFSADQNTVHTYTAAGNYTVSLIAMNPDGNTTRLVADRIIAGTVKADFIANATSGAVPLAVKFTDTSANNPVSWNWSFGDGVFSDLQNPIHTYSGSGWYNVTLIANNTYGTDQRVRIQYINAAAGGLSGDTDIPGLAIVTPSWTPEPLLNRSAILAVPGADLTVSGNDAIVTNASPSLSSVIFHYTGLIDIGGNVSGTLQSVDLTTIPVLTTLGSYGPTQIYVTLNLAQYTAGKTVTVLVSDSPSAADAAAFSAAAGSTRPLQALAYETEINTTNAPSYLNNADIYFTVPLTWSNTYGSDNIRLFRITGVPPTASVLPTSLYSTTSTTATYHAITPGFSHFSPGAISSAPAPASPSVPSSSADISGSDSGSGIISVPEKPAVVSKVEPVVKKEAVPKEIEQKNEPGISPV